MEKTEMTGSIVLGLGILGLVAWILVAIWPARVAQNKGYGFILWFLISLFFWWATLFVVYFVLHDKTVTPEDREASEAVDELMDRKVDQS
jgi:phosphotransferase system  glucose/maltose/N-acetylglucosamine-specific IIC component